MSYDTLGLSAIQGIGSSLPELLSGSTDTLSRVRPSSMSPTALIAMRPLFRQMQNSADNGDAEGFDSAQRIAIGGVTTAAALDILDAGDALELARKVGDAGAVKAYRSRQLAAVGTVLLMKWLTDRMRPTQPTPLGEMRL